MNTLENLESELRGAEFALCAKQCVKGVLMDKRLEQEFFLVYETLLSALEKCKDSPNLAKFSTDIKKQLKYFEEEYPEIVSEYYLKHRP